MTAAPARNHVIGGTDAADLLGIGRTSPTHLYLRLCGEIEDDFQGNTATKGGTLFEDRVAVELIGDELDLELVRPEYRVLTLADEPRIGVSFDFEIANREGRPLAEIKCTGSRKMWGNPGDKVPPGVAAQAQFQMALKRDRGLAVPCNHVIAFFQPGWELEDFEITEDQELGSVLIGAARDMLEAVDAGQPPDPRGAEEARMIFLGRRGESHVCTDEELSLLDQLHQAKNSRKVCEEQEKALLDALLPAFGTDTEIVNPHTGEVMATWRQNRSFDFMRFSTDHPELSEKYRKGGTDLTRLGKDHPKTKAAYMSEPVNPTASNRPFKLRKKSHGKPYALRKKS